MKIVLKMGALLSAMTTLCGCSGQVAEDAPEQPRAVTYACDRHKDISVEFFPDQGKAILVRNGGSMELQQRPTASGFLYSNGPNTIRGKGDELTLEIGRMMPIQCRAR